MCNNNSGLENQTGPELNSHCFLRSSPENRASPRTSPNHHISNGPFNKVVCELLTRGGGVCVPFDWSSRRVSFVCCRH